MKARFNMSDFVKERNEALFSLDEDKIKAYFKKYGVPIPGNEIVFWGGIYKIIYNIKDAPKELKHKAYEWLIEHNMSPIIY